MKDSKSLIIVLSVIILLVIIGAGAAVLRDSLGPIKPVVPEGQKAESQLPVPTGDIGDVVDALEQELIDEMESVYDEESVYSTISETVEINDLGQAADDAGL